MHSTLQEITDRAELQPAELKSGWAGQGIRANVAWMITGTLWSGLCQWSLVVVLAKLGAVDIVGAYTLSVAIVLPVLMFSCLNLRALYVTDCGCDYRFREYLALRLLMSAVSVALTLAVASQYEPRMLATVGLISLAKAFEYVSDILYGPMQRQERMASISISMMLRGTISLLGLGLAIYLTGSLIWGAAALVCSSAIVMWGFDLPVSMSVLGLRPRQAFSEHWLYIRELASRKSAGLRHLRSLAMAGAPLGLVLMLVSLNLNIPRYFVERSLGIREQGIFSSLANLMAAGNVAVGALGQCATPRLAKHFAAGEMRPFRLLAWILVGTSLGLGLAGFAVAAVGGHRLLAIVYRPEYAARQDVFVALMAASGVVYLGNTMGVILMSARCLTPQLPLFAISAVVTALTCLALVPPMGLQGATIAIFLSACVQCAGGALLLRSVCRRRAAAGA